MPFTQIDYHIAYSNHFSRVGYIKIKNGKKIETPINWIGLSIVESSDFQFTAFKEAGVKNFLSNVYDLKYQDKKGIRDDLINHLIDEGLNHKIDSGGFQLMKQELTNKKKNDLDSKIVYDIQNSIPCDIGVVLDVPIGTENVEINIFKKIDATVKNFENLLKYYDDNVDDFSILPVIHGHSKRMLNYSIQKIKDVIGDEPQALGIGSLVPMVKSIKNSGFTGGKKNFIKILMYLRKKLPNTFIHAFGIGGTMAYLAFLCGVDSIDSNGWILKASRGVIQLPGVSDRFLKEKSHRRPFLINNRIIRGSKKKVNEIKLFMNCGCPICVKYYKDEKWTYNDWIKKRNDFDQYTEESRLKRVIHNLWLYQNELKLIKKAIINEKIVDFMEDRLQNSSYKKLFKEIKLKLESPKLTIDYF